LTKKKRAVLVALVVGLAVLGLWFALAQVSLAALDEPGRVETYIATTAKHWFVGRSAHTRFPPEPPRDAMSITAGRMYFGGSCGSCHGFDGRTPTDAGRWMYPRVPDLGSTSAQQWLDSELFWIIKNGIRLTGMPGFGNIHSDEEIWHLVHYVRSLGAAPQD